MPDPARTSPVRAVMTFARDPEASCRWYAEHVLPLPEDATRIEQGFAFIESGDVEIGFHPADEERNPFGASVVIYFAVDSVAAARERCLAAGATHHRGPLRIDDTRSISQLTDPFGTVFGLDGGA